MAAADTRSPEVKAYVRRRTGVAAATTDLSLQQRVMRSKWTWFCVGLVLSCTATIVLLVRDLMMDRYFEDGSLAPGLNAAALKLCAGRALPTLLFWVVCFILIDRYKPQRLLAWFFAVAWGGCVAVFASYHINSWAGAQMAVIDDQSGVSAVRTAVFVAPFVEEATKACIIFLIAVVDRNRFTSRVSGAVIGGLAGAGFAFTENIVYYARVVVYGSYTAGTGDVMGYLDELVFLRGVLTCFGHPLFTMMTGLGVAFAVATRSKIVRVLAPGAGFLLAVFLHMFFNWQASITPYEQLIFRILVIAWPVVILVILRLVVTTVKQGRTIQARLTDFVAMGWLPSDYPASLSRVLRRVWTLFMSLWHGNPISTWKLQVRATELAMMREAMLRGTVDAGGLSRELDLIDELAELARRNALVDSRGLRPYFPWNALRRRGRLRLPPPVRWTPPIGGAAQAPVKYSAVDPRWGPPS